MYLKKIKVGNVELPNNVIAGPMAGVSDMSFRTMLLDVKPGLVYTEMISDKGINYRNVRTLEMCEVMEEEHPIALQLFGYEIDEMIEATKYIDTHSSCDIIDINMGCPVSKVVKTNGGSSHLKTPDHAVKLVKEMKKHTNKPISVKIRTGWDSESIVAPELAKGLEEAGVSMIAIHGRTRAQMYKDTVDYETIRKVKESVNIPVIGNGDIKSGEDAVHMMKETGVDGVMVARGLLNNPWLIEEIKHSFEGKDYELDMSVEEKFMWLDKHLKTMIENLGESLAIRKMRGHAAWFVAGLDYSKELKSAFVRMNSYAEFDKIVNDYLVEKRRVR